MEDLYVGYMKKAMAADEILEAIDGPAAEAGAALSDLQGVEALRLRHLGGLRRVRASSSTADRIERCRVAFGGMAATPKRAAATEQALAGKRWTEATARAAMAALETDYTPLTDMRASAAYRTATAQNLLYRFFLETRTGQPVAGGRGQRVRGRRRDAGIR